MLGEHGGSDNRRGLRQQDYAALSSWVSHIDDDDFEGVYFENQNDFELVFSDGVISAQVKNKILTPKELRTVLDKLPTHRKAYILFCSV